MKLSHLVVTILLPVMLSGCGSKEDKVVIGYCKALDAGRIDEAEAYLSKDAKQMLNSAGGKPLLAATGGQFKQHKGIKKVKITNKKITGEKGIVEFLYNFKDGSTYADSFPIVKENGTWKIDK